MITQIQFKTKEINLKEPILEIEKLITDKKLIRITFYVLSLLKIGNISYTNIEQNSYTKNKSLDKKIKSIELKLQSHKKKAINYLIKFIQHNNFQKEKLKNKLTLEKK